MGDWLIEDFNVELWVISQTYITNKVWNIRKTAINIARFTKVIRLWGKLQSIFR